MTQSRHSHLDDAFIQKQRDRLLKLRQQLIDSGDAAGAEEGTLQQAAGNEPRDEVDDGDRLEQEADDEALLSHSEERIIAIDRALEKIRENTYGISDGNGEPIDRARLEAVPEAIYTIEELRQRERRGA